MAGTTVDDTKLTSLAVAEIGSGLITPFEGQPLAALGGRATTNGLFDDFIHYQGPLAAGSSGGLTLGTTATGALSSDTAHTAGAGVLRFALPAVADAVSLETERNLLELGSKSVKAVVKMTPNNMTDLDIHMGLGTAAVVHGTADSADMVEVRWNAATAQAELRTQRNGGGVTTTVGSVALNARVAGQSGNMLLGIVARADGTVAGLVSINDGQTWDVVRLLASGDASLPIAGDPLALYVAGVGVVAAGQLDVDYWTLMVGR